jgi:hypothetical protein
MTKTQARQLAARARRYGYSDLGAGQIQVICPCCRQRVTTCRNYRYRPARKGEPGIIDPRVLGGRMAVFEQESVIHALDRAMVDHLITECS